MNNATPEELARLTEEFGHITIGTTRCHMVENGVTFYFPLKLLERLVADRRTLERYRGALQRITEIEDKLDGGDWDEIIEARVIAREALSKED